MRYPTNVTLDSVVFHSLDARKDGLGFKPSKGLLPLGIDQELIAYITTHIRQSLKHSVAKAAKFSCKDETEAFDTCNAMHENQTSLLAGSTFLAEKFYKIMLKDGRINPGILAFCFYRDSDSPDEERRLGLLKIDLGKVFRTATLQDDAGNDIVTIERDQDALTTTKERLHKSAFIRVLTPRATGYDMILLDRQSRNTRDEERGMVPTIAKFFIEDFLGAEDAIDATERTRSFHIGVISAVKTLRHQKRIDLALEGMVVRAMEVAMTSAAINIEDWVDALSLPSESKDILWDIITRKQPDMEFSPDENYVRQTLNKSRFVGPNGLMVTMDADHEHLIIVRDEVEVDGLQEYRLITLRTKEWERTS